MIGKIYESKRTEGVTAKVIKFEEKFKTVIIEYLTGDKTGTSSSITTATLKRWWKEIEVINETDEELELLAGRDSKEQTESVIVEKELTDKGYAKIGLEIAQQVKKKTKKCSVDRSKDIQNIVDLLEDDYEYKYYDSVNCYKVFDIMNENKTIAEIYPQKKKISCYFKTLQGHNLQNVLFSREGYKYYLPARVDISYECDYINILNNLLMEV